MPKLPDGQLAQGCRSANGGYWPHAPCPLVRDTHIYNARIARPDLKSEGPLPALRVDLLQQFQHSRLHPGFVGHAVQALAHNNAEEDTAWAHSRHVLHNLQFVLHLIYSIHDGQPVQVQLPAALAASRVVHGQGKVLRLCAQCLRSVEGACRVVVPGCLMQEIKSARNKISGKGSRKGNASGVLTCTMT
jgi:hypothetical protein